MKKGAEKILGVEAIMHTPFKDNYELDLQGARRLIRHIIDGGITEGTGLILVAGAVGEFYAMSVEERKKLAEACLEEAAGETPIVVNASDTDLNVVKEIAHHAEEHGAYALQLSPPYYMPLSDKELVNFYSEVSDEISIGLMIYANYWASQVYFDNIMDEICQIDNVVSMKWAHPDASVFANTLIEYGDKLAFMDNQRAINVWPYMIGMRGFISQIGVYAPEVALRKWKLVKEKDWDGVAEHAKKVDVPLMNWIGEMMDYGICGEGNPLKEASKLLGLPAGPARPPHDIPLPDDLREELRMIFIKAGLLDGD